MIRLSSELPAQLATLAAGRQPSYSSIRDDAADDPRLAGHDIRVLLYLDRHGAGDGTLKRSQQAIADALGCARQTVWRSMRRLRACGYLARLSRWAVQAGQVRRMVDALHLVGRRHTKPRPKPAHTVTAPPVPPYVPPAVPEGFRGKRKRGYPQGDAVKRLADRLSKYLDESGEPCRQNK